MKLLLFALAGWLVVFTPLAAQPTPKPRVFVLTDIEADPDDTQSLIRFLLYANHFDVEGLVATTSIHQKNRVAPESIRAVLDAYGQVQPNLLKHDRGYPTAADLKAKVKKGLPVYGMAGVGEGRDSEGSEWLIRVLERPDSRPLWVTVWGGANVLAQAVWKIRATRAAPQAESLIRKLRVYTISDQDDSGPWLRKTCPTLFFIATPGYTYGRATWMGLPAPLPGANNDVIADEWLARHIQQGHGPLGAAYPDVAYGMEGDTPSFLGLIPNGLNAPDYPDYGGWGGRYQFYTPKPDTLPDPFARPNWPVARPETRPLWTNAEDSLVSPLDKKPYKSSQATIWRWREEIQHDFAARMDWTTKPYAAANHPPVPKLAHPDHLTVKSGQVFRLSAAGTTDPDGDSMSYLWMQYPEVGTYPLRISFRPYAANLYELPVTAPAVEWPQTLHFILKVTDKGTPALTRYKRVIVQVVPK